MDHPQAESDRTVPATEHSLDRAIALVEFLRAHCPWDAAQTPATLRRHLLEEAHEVVDAIAREDEAGLRDQLGDLLLNVAFQIVLGEERGAWDREAVVRGLEEKLQRRHPHLFGRGDAEPWEAIKARERAARGDAGLLADVEVGADPLSRAQRLQARAASVGFDWSDTEGPLNKVREETEEVRVALASGDSTAMEDELGDLFFAAVNLARRAGVDAVSAVATANAKFTRRFRAVEQLAATRGLVMSTMELHELDELWDAVKQVERA